MYILPICEETESIDEVELTIATSRFILDPQFLPGFHDLVRVQYVFMSLILGRHTPHFIPPLIIFVLALGFT